MAGSRTGPGAATFLRVNVLVTGSSGFAGYWLLRHLHDRGDEVVTFPDDLDVRDVKALNDAVDDAAPEGVIHLAAQASVQSSWDDPTTTFEVNALGTLNLLGAIARSRPTTRVVVVSSAEVYGTLRPADLPVAEDAKFAPASPYAASKAAAELIGLQAWLGQGLPVVAARPFNHTGPGQRSDFVVPGLARQVADAVRQGAQELRTGNLNVRRDITDVRDVVRAYRLLLESGHAGTAYNVCRGTSVSIEEVARRLLALAGADLPLVVDPARQRAVDQPDVRGDPARLQRATDWTPAIDLDRTLGDVLDWWVASDPAPAG